MVGFWQEADKYGSYNNREDPKGIALASSSTFESIHSGNNENNEAPARIPHGFFDVELPDIPRGQDDFGNIEFRRSLLPIDTHQELLWAYADRISITPYPCLTMASSSQSVLSVKVNATRIFVERGPQVIQRSFSSKSDEHDSNIFEQASSSTSNTKKDNQNQLELRVLQLPVGATYDSGSALLTWEPTHEQIGAHEILSAVSFSGGGGGACHVALTLNVTYPSIQLPISNPSQLVVDDETESVVVAWDFYEEESSYNYQEDTQQVVPAFSRVTAVHIPN